MSYLLRRAAASAGLAVCGWSTLLLAQSTTVVVPDRTQMRRALPVAPAQAPPVVQQSPNGLYKLSITDTGIELRGPRGTVTIDNGGITIGGPGTRTSPSRPTTWTCEWTRTPPTGPGVTSTKAWSYILIKVQRDRRSLRRR